MEPKNICVLVIIWKDLCIHCDQYYWISRIS